MEIEKHEKKLLKISKLSENELEESKDRLFSKINFINEELIPEKIWLKAEKALIHIDADDIDFLALTMHLKGKLWTGDLKLYRGLRNNKYKSVFTTSELIKLKNRI
jgi:predicted nucleic acid-binding protein